MLAMGRTIPKRSAGPARIAVRPPTLASEHRPDTCNGENRYLRGKDSHACDTIINRNVIAVTFEAEANAFEAFSRLKELDSRDDIDLHAAAVVAREDDGKLVEKDEYDEENYEDTVGGGLLGLVVGVLGRNSRPHCLL